MREVASEGKLVLIKIRMMHRNKRCFHKESRGLLDSSVAHAGIVAPSVRFHDKCG